MLYITELLYLARLLLLLVDFPYRLRRRRDLQDHNMGIWEWVILWDLRIHRGNELIMREAILMGQRADFQWDRIRVAECLSSQEEEVQQWEEEGLRIIPLEEEVTNLDDHHQ